MSNPAQISKHHAYLSSLNSLFGLSAIFRLALILVLGLVSVPAGAQEFTTANRDGCTFAAAGKKYLSSSLGEGFQSILDTSAFETLP
ncbi:MAG: hypothetical protein K0U98_06715 [Deltaproteobacteria bacterium]|nr:hypothetical protein [Deltaproteobacteria bacterium]